MKFIHSYLESHRPNILKHQTHISTLTIKQPSTTSFEESLSSNMNAHSINDPINALPICTQSINGNCALYVHTESNVTKALCN